MQYSRDLEMEKVAGESMNSQVFFHSTPIEDLTAISVTDLPIHVIDSGILARMSPRQI